MVQKFIAVSNEKEIRIIPLNALYAVRVENYLCTLYYDETKRFACTKTIKEMQLLLPDYFCKVNRNLLLNVTAIVSVNLKRRTIEMKSGDSFDYSRRSLSSIKEKIAKFSFCYDH
ncbi:MAG: LytTR family transcriptional regulator [Bacteroidales bacterium]|nr:LytTR family transcriptional regulator [Bacteroidales bacterium]